MATVFIGVDPHKLSVTVEVVDDRERVLGTGRFGTDKAGYAAMRQKVRAWPERVWAVEGSNGAGRPLAQRLLADGEYVVDVPAKLAARVRLFDTGHNRKNDARDAHSMTVVAVRTAGLRVLPKPLLVTRTVRVPPDCASTRNTDDSGLDIPQRRSRATLPRRSSSGTTHEGRDRMAPWRQR